MLVITSANSADASQILALQKRAYESEARLYNDWTIPPLAQTIESLLNEIASITVLKATEDEALVGSVRASLQRHTCHIGRLIVEPSAQGRGVGTTLLRAIEQSFPQATQFELFTGSRSTGNIRLYQRHGYEITATKTLSDQVALVVMTKPARDA